MSLRQSSLPMLWLLSDARNDAALAPALTALPRGSGFVFRHHHLAPFERAARFRMLAPAARAGGHLVVVADDAATARAWGADGVYGAGVHAAVPGALLRLATAHRGEELAAAAASGVDGVFLSPVFATRSHPGAATLGVHGFHVLAQASPVPVIALGGMNPARARELAWPRWGAIDGLGLPHAS